MYVDNDANIAALGEKHKGAGEGADDVVAITLGTGLGGGIISNGEIVHGHNGSGAEIGHFNTSISSILNVWLFWMYRNSCFSDKRC